MAQHYYKLLQESATGRKLAAFWQACIKVERRAEAYAKSMGAQYYYSDPKYFAGGVACVGFADKVQPNLKMWREAGEVDGQMQYVPNVDKHVEWVEVPDAQKMPQNTFDCIYNPHQQPVERDGKLYRSCLKFEYHEESGRSDQGVRVASRDIRKAIKAEVHRIKLPVVKVETLLQLLQADWLPADKTDGKPVKGPQSTPTFFTYEQYYVVGCEYECKSVDMVDITPQQYRTFSDLAKRMADKKSS